MSLYRSGFIAFNESDYLFSSYFALLLGDDINTQIPFSLSA